LQRRGAPGHPTRENRREPAIAARWQACCYGRRRVLLGLIASLALAQTAPPIWTLDDALAALLRSSPELDEARARERAAHADIAQAGLLPNPELQASLGNLPLRANAGPGGNGGGFSRNAVASVALSQPLEAGGKREKRVAAATSRAAAARASFGDALRLARFEVSRAFWTAVTAKAKRALAEEIRLRYAETIRISRARFQADDISAADLDKIVLEGARQENDLADARTAFSVAVQELLRIAGAGAPPEVDVAGELAAPAAPTPALDALVKLAVAHRADLAVARERVETARRDLALARAQAIPDVTIGASYTHSQGVIAGDNPDTLGFTVGLPLPLFSRNQGEVAKARIELDAATRAVEAAEDRARREIAGALARLGAAEEKARRYDEGVLARARRALDVAEKAYRDGATGLLALLEAERTFIQLRGDALDTQLELRTARLELERAAGEDPFKERP
jgi:outer membrane protein, heavy metal efflux system